LLAVDISEALAGITFLALANGAPDVITAIVAGTSSSDSTSLLPFGSLFGASLFSMAIILSKVIELSPDEKVELNMKEVLVPLGFYIVGTTYLVLVSIVYGKMNLILAFVFLGLYPLYILFVIYS
jgi:sodium/potassium/calcium exchanger 6